VREDAERDGAEACVVGGIGGHIGVVHAMGIYSKYIVRASGWVWEYELVDFIDGAHTVLKKEYYRGGQQAVAD
jgi:hypothetical protein